MKNSNDMVSGSLDEQYERALIADRGKIFGDIRAPSLFNWFLGMNSLVTGFVFILNSHLIEQFRTGRFAGWFMPLQTTFILGGLGLILSEMVERSNRWWKVVFRLVVATALAVLSLIWWLSGDFDGVFMALWLVVVILLNIVADLSSFRSYLIFYQGIFIGLALIFSFFPSFSGLRTVIPTDISVVWRALAFLSVVVYAGLSCWSYFADKRRSSGLIGLACLSLVVLAFAYANVSEWLRAFMVLTTALFAFLLPFWDELRFRQGKWRQWVIRMFGIVLALFLVTIVLIRILQNILITNTHLVLSDKVTYGRIFADTTISNALSAIKSLAENAVLKRVLIRNQTRDLTDLARGFFEGNRSLIRVVTVDHQGTILSVYPLTEGLVGQSLAGESYFSRAISTELPVISDLLPAGVGLSGRKSVALVAPVIEKGRVAGALVGYLNLTSLADGLAQIATPVTGEYFVMTDRSGSWVMGPNDSAPDQVGDILVSSQLQKGIVRKGYGRDGVLILAAGTDLSISGWRLFLAQPLFAALVINQTGYIVVLSLTSLTALIIGLTVLAERRVESDKNE